MIAKREEKIRSFIPEGYYGMTAKGQNIMLTWQDQKSKSYRSFDKENDRTDEKAGWTESGSGRD